MGLLIVQAAAVQMLLLLLLLGHVHDCGTATTPFWECFNILALLFHLAAALPNAHTPGVVGQAKTVKR
jgi:hypothetical protein